MRKPGPVWKNNLPVFTEKGKNEGRIQNLEYHYTVRVDGDQDHKLAFPFCDHFTPLSLLCSLII